jgi:hypothetical protein
MNELPEAEQERTPVPSFLRRAARRRPLSDNVEYCELCGTQITVAHQHLLNHRKREIACSCDGCAVLFCGQPGAHYLRIPRRIRTLSDFQMPNLQWESLMIPINLAFFYYNTAEGRMMAMYPSPAGAIESLLSLESWTEIATQHLSLQTMEPDVETFLVNRVGTSPEYYIVPIDECFHLVGLIRLHWSGLSGGAEVWKHINEFFASLKARSNEVRESHTSQQPEPTHA